MATAETVDLGPPHPPKEEALKAFDAVHVDIKKALQHLRHDANKHEPEYFAAVASLSDHELTAFTTSDISLVRVASSAYGLHIFYKVHIADDNYIHVRVFVSEDGPKFHSIRQDEIEKEDGDKVFKAIFKDGDELVWFDA